MDGEAYSDVKFAKYDYYENGQIQVVIEGSIMGNANDMYNTEWEGKLIGYEEDGSLYQIYEGTFLYLEPFNGYCIGKKDPPWWRIFFGEADKWYKFSVIDGEFISDFEEIPAPTP